MKSMTPRKKPPVKAQTYRYKMDEGLKLNRSQNRPALYVIGDGPLTYLWVGNDAEGDRACFATICGETNLRRIAHAILKQLGEPANDAGREEGKP